MTHTCNRPTRLKQSSCLKLSTSRDNTQWVSAETNQKELELAYDWECYYTPVFSSIRHAYESLAVVFGCFGIVCACVCVHVLTCASESQVVSGDFLSFCQSLTPSSLIQPGWPASSWDPVSHHASTGTTDAGSYTLPVCGWCAGHPHAGPHGCTEHSTDWTIL